MSTKIIVCFNFEKVEKISEIFWKILGNFSKKIEGDKTPNFENFRKFVNENEIKHLLLGVHTIPTFWRVPPKLYSGYYLREGFVLG